MASPDRNLMAGQITRRDLFKLAGGFTVSALLGPAAVQPATHISRTIEKITGMPAGNAALEDKVHRQCPPEKDIRTCEKEYVFPEEDRLVVGVLAPIVEETFFRAGPSAVYDCVVNGHSLEEAIQNLRFGTENMVPTRREFLFGLAQATVFALVHNVTESGFDTRHIPGVQFLMGNIFWILQRRFGIASSSAFHITFNTFAIQMQNAGK